jgi:hypothetical protein
MQNFFLGKKQPKDLGYYIIFIKLPKVNNDPIGETRPNLVTLGLRLATNQGLDF